MKPLLASVLFATALFGSSEGYEIYQKHCASCHMVMLPLHEPERAEKKAQMKAPTMRMVAMRLRMMINIKDENEDIQKKVIKAFVKEYIDDPDEDYVLCMPIMVEKFGIMPPVKGLTNAEKEAVAEWLWEQY